MSSIDGFEFEYFVRRSLNNAPSSNTALVAKIKGGVPGFRYEVRPLNGNEPIDADGATGRTFKREFEINFTDPEPNNRDGYTLWIFDKNDEYTFKNYDLNDSFLVASNFDVSSYFEERTLVPDRDVIVFSVAHGGSGTVFSGDEIAVTIYDKKNDENIIENHPMNDLSGTGNQTSVNFGTTESSDRMGFYEYDIKNLSRNIPQKGEEFELTLKDTVNNLADTATATYTGPADPIKQFVVFNGEGDDYFFYIMHYGGSNDDSVSYKYDIKPGKHYNQEQWNRSSQSVFYNETLFDDYGDIIFQGEYSGDVENFTLRMGAQQDLTFFDPEFDVSGLHGSITSYS